MNATSNVDTDGDFDLRHRVLGALVLVVLGIVVLPIILNGASMEPQEVTIAAGDGEKKPRTFETNIRPVNSDESTVKIESESRDKLEAKVSFSKPDIPEVKGENAPSTEAPDLGTPDQKTTAGINSDDGTLKPPVLTEANTSILDTGVDSSVIEPLPEVKLPDAKLPDAEQPVAAQTIPPTNPAQQTAADTSPAESVSEDSVGDKKGVTDNQGSKTTADVVKISEGAGSNGTTSKQVIDKGVDKPDENEKQVQVSGVTGWVVRVGTFGEVDNAVRMVDLLRSQGFDGQTTVNKTKSGKSLTRVWVGPFADRDSAARKLSKIQEMTGEKGFITAYP